MTLSTRRLFHLTCCLLLLLALVSSSFSTRISASASDVVVDESSSLSADDDADDNTNTNHGGINYDYDNKAEIAAQAAAKRASISPEELAQQIADNTITDADLLPIDPPSKPYIPSSKPEFALLVTPGRGRSAGCNFRTRPQLKEFLYQEAKYYPSLQVEYIHGGEPKLKFYATKELRDKAMIHGKEMTHEELLELLRNGPNPETDPLLSISFKERDPSLNEIRHLLAEHKLFRADTPDETHSANLIFSPEWIPEEEEWTPTGEDKAESEAQMKLQ